VASPSTSGSRGGEQTMPLRDQRGAYTMAGHGGSAQSQLASWLSSAILQAGSAVVLMLVVPLQACHQPTRGPSLLV
jgi:hypothetical protein